MFDNYNWSIKTDLKKPNKNDIDLIFIICNDYYLQYFIALQWADINLFGRTQNLKQKSPEIYEKVISGVFLTEFKSHIDRYYFSQAKKDFENNGFLDENLNALEKNIATYNNLIRQNKQNGGITYFSENYIDFIQKGLDNLYTELNQLSKGNEINNTPSLKTVFGKNFDFIEKLYYELEAKGFINEDETSLEKFLQHFDIKTKPKNKILLHGYNLSDLGLLMHSLKPFFVDQFQEPNFLNSFWSDRFKFKTIQMPIAKSKDSASIMRIISDATTPNSKRRPRRKSTINELINNLKQTPQ